MCVLVHSQQYVIDHVLMHLAQGGQKRMSLQVSLFSSVSIDLSSGSDSYPYLLVFRDCHAHNLRKYDL